MSEDKIIQTEVDLLSTAINRIISSEVLETAMSDQLPLTNNLPDSNKIYQGKVSVLFVDMRESTKLPEKFNTTQLVKIYRSYIRTVVQAIRYSGGVVRDFMGDGVLAVFIDNDEGKCEDKAVRAARYITTTIDKILNPALDKAINHRISCGIGIHSGEISLSKVGMKGKEHHDDSENEYGIAWIGNSTNLACKFSGAVGNGTIFISCSTFAELSDVDGKKNWKRINIYKGNNDLTGYVAEHFYLELDTDISPCYADEDSAPLSTVEVIKKEYQKQIDDLTRRAEALGKREQALQDKEIQLNKLAAELNQKGKQIISDRNDLQRQEYDFYCDVVGSAHCKKEYTKAMGKSFWEKYCNKAIAAGRKIGKDEHQVKQEISYAMVDIYQNLEIYDRAYDFVVEQATGLSWLHLFTVQNIVNKVGYSDRLKNAVVERLKKNNLPSGNRTEFEKIRSWLLSL